MGERERERKLNLGNDVSSFPARVKVTTSYSKTDHLGVSAFF